MKQIGNRGSLFNLLLPVMVFSISACAYGPIIRVYLDEFVNLLPRWMQEGYDNFAPILLGVDDDVTEGMETPTGPAPKGVEGLVGEILTDEFTVSVFGGNAAEFNTPPKIFIANYTEYPSPPGGKITYYADTVYPFYGWLSFPNIGSWIELRSTERTTSIGVEVWGDYADGWVVVSVDGIQIWSGNTKFENCEFDSEGNRIVSPETCAGGFFYYIQASGLENTSHIIRAENAGGGEMTVYFFGLGLANP